MNKATSHVIVQDLETADFRVSGDMTKDLCMYMSRGNTSLAPADLKMIFQRLSLRG